MGCERAQNNSTQFVTADATTQNALIEFKENKNQFKLNKISESSSSVCTAGGQPGWEHNNKNTKKKKHS